MLLGKHEINRGFTGLYSDIGRSWFARAHDGVIRRLSPVYVHLVDRALDDDLHRSVGDLIRETARRHAAASSEDEVGAVDEPLGGGTPNAQRQGVILGKGALPLQRRQR